MVLFVVGVVLVDWAEAKKEVKNLAMYLQKEKEVSFPLSPLLPPRKVFCFLEDKSELEDRNDT